MFTGIIQQTGRIAAITRTGAAGGITIEAAPWTTPFEKGESIAVSGVCLTLTGWEGSRLRFDLLEETFLRTSLGSRATGDRVNLERALRVGDAMGGHFVTGHVDGVGRVRGVRSAGRDRVVEIACDGGLLSGVVPKGSIALDGISLTVVDLRDTWFSVHLIPHTWAVTAACDYKAGDAVNLETDMIGKYVQRFLARGSGGSGVTWETLRKAGFTADGCSL